MIIVAGKWEYPWLYPDVELYQWKGVILPFEVDKLIMTPILNVEAREMNLEQMRSIEEVIDKYRDFKKIFVECPKDISDFTNLKNYTHPKDNCLYIFGNAAAGNQGFIRNEDDVIGIDTPNKTMMWAVVSCGIVLYDRLIKNG